MGRLIGGAGWLLIFAVFGGEVMKHVRGHFRFNGLVRELVVKDGRLIDGTRPNPFDLLFHETGYEPLVSFVFYATVIGLFAMLFYEARKGWKS